MVIEVPKENDFSESCHLGQLESSVHQTMQVIVEDDKILCHE